jgi:hypothetical protein
LQRTGEAKQPVKFDDPTDCVMDGPDRCVEIRLADRDGDVLHLAVVEVRSAA